jgi:hypothetical protein
LVHVFQQAEGKADESVLYSTAEVRRELGLMK